MKKAIDISQASKVALLPHWSRQRAAIAVLTIVYLVGIAGILIPIHPEFIRLTPVNLLFSLGLVLYFHRPWNTLFGWFLLTCFGLGFLAEVVGVQTGLVFGQYQYGTVLGLKLWDTPLMIGVNWVMVTYCTAMTIGILAPGQSPWLKSLWSALLMVGLDVLIEPVAIDRGFWDWGGNAVPLQNYLAWFGIGFVLQLFFHSRVSYRPNFVAVALLILQFLFFGILYLAA